ncbi:unnamed protein product [Closterium sp. Naga37s-1]|nr:unnamed protein product [Closterium sp. Naga37s-1]
MASSSIIIICVPLRVRHPARPAAALHQLVPTTPKLCEGEVVVRLNDSVPVPAPCKGEVLVRVRAASINPGDWKVQSGLIPFLPRRFPATAGIVVAVGPGATKYSVGDAVFGRAPFFKMGALAQYAVLETAASAHKPSSLTFETASALPVVGLTALQAVRDCACLPLPASREEPKPGFEPPQKPSAVHSTGSSAKAESNSTVFGTSTSRSDGSGNRARVLVANASGGVGHMAVQLAKAAGAHVTATVGARNLAFARNVLGADEVLDYNSSAGKQLFASSSLSPSPATSLSAPAATQVTSTADLPDAGLYDAVIDFSPSSLTVSAVDRVLRPEGRWVHVELPLSLLALGLWRRLALRPRRLCPVMMEMMENKGADLEVLGRMAEEGKVRVVVESSVAFEEAREAWRRSMGGHVTGKVVVRMD